MRRNFAIVLAALWWGSLTGLGFLVVPMLFSNLSSPAIAGAMAAKLFTAQTWLGTACAMLLLMIANKPDEPLVTAQLRVAVKFVVAGLLLAILVEFGVSPHIASAQASGGSIRFWHGLGSAMYFGQWLCAGLALWRFANASSSMTAATGAYESNVAEETL